MIGKQGVHWSSDIGPGHGLDSLLRTPQNALSVPLGEPFFSWGLSLLTPTDRATSPPAENGALLRLVRHGRVRG